MAIDVTQYPQTAYRQTPVAWPVSIFNPPTQKPSNVVLSFDWTVYFALMSARVGATLAANIAVEVDANSGGTSQGGVIDKIVTAKIDNSNSLNPILVFFPDSGDTISCAPQTIATLPCNTNSSKCFVIAQGLATGFLPKTTVTFYNYFIPPSIDPVLQLVYPQWLGSPTIQRNQNQILTPGFAPPALGDQSVQYAISLVNATTQTGIFGTPLVSGFVYITGVDVRYVTFLAGGTSNVIPSLLLESTGSAGVLFNWLWMFPIASGIYSLYNQSGLQIKIDATQSWRLRWTFQPPSGSGATALAGFSYTINDK